MILICESDINFSVYFSCGCDFLNLGCIKMVREQYNTVVFFSFNVNKIIMLNVFTIIFSFNVNEITERKNCCQSHIKPVTSL